MARPVAVADLKSLTGSTLSDAIAGLFITPANLIVSDLNDKCGKEFDETRLEQIELYLAAHFLTERDKGLAVVSEKFENAERKYQTGNQNLSGILSTKWGQTANALSEGCLVDFDKEASKVDFA